MTLDSTDVILVTCFDRSEIPEKKPPFVITVFRKGDVREIIEFPTKKARTDAVEQIQRDRDITVFNPWGD
jgi:hypothetical protein